MSKIQSCTKHKDSFTRWTKGDECPTCKLKDQLATADKHIGWLKDDKISLNKSIKIRDGAMDAFIDLEKVAAKKLATAQAENEDLQAGINCGAARYDKLWNERVELKAENKRLEDIIVRFKAGCKITGKGPVSKNCEMVRLTQTENERLHDALEKIETAQTANMKPNSVALYQMFVKETAAQALGRKVKEHGKWAT